MCRIIASIVVGVLACALNAGSAVAGVAAPHSTVEGKTLGEWSADWWKYVFSVPSADSPLFDTTGAKAHIGQSGSVFFLAGTLSINGVPPAGPSTFDRTVTVGPDQFLFFPVKNSWADNLGVDSPSTVQQLRDQAAAGVDVVTGLHASIDGAEVANLTDHREVSPAFSYTIPNDNVFNRFGFNFPAQTVSPAVADGYYLMVEPLAPGVHTINFGQGQGPDSGLDVTYHLNVTSAVPLPGAAWAGMVTLPLLLVARRLCRL